MDPRLGRMIVLGNILGCGPSTISTAAGMGYRDPFVMPISDQQKLQCNKQKLSLCRGYPSDHIGLSRAIDGFTSKWNQNNSNSNSNYGGNGVGAAYNYCDENFLSKSEYHVL